MQLARPTKWSELAGSIPEDTLKLIADPSGRPWRQLPADRTGQSLAVVVGPEGGWVDEELELADRHGWLRINLGNRILRVETAAIALAACAAIAR